MSEQESPKIDHSTEISQLIESTLSAMGIQSRVSIEQTVNGYSFNISSPDSSLLIGQRGANLQALQTLIHSAAIKKLGMVDRFSIDIDDYKKKREWYLRETAKRALERVKKTGRPVMLEPMSPADRRIVHAYLSTDFDYETESRGEGVDRRVVIKPKDKLI